MEYVALFPLDIAWGEGSSGMDQEVEELLVLASDLSSCIQSLSGCGKGVVAEHWFLEWDRLTSIEKKMEIGVPSGGSVLAALEQYSVSQ